MTIVLLSKSSNTLYGIRISEHFSFLTIRLEHPTSPVLLTKSGPLKDFIQCDTTAKIAPPSPTPKRLQRKQEIMGGIPDIQSGPKLLSQNITPKNTKDMATPTMQEIMGGIPEEELLVSEILASAGYR